MNGDEDIPQEWIEAYVKGLLAAAKKLPAGNLRQAVMRRAIVVQDLLAAWRKGSVKSQANHKPTSAIPSTPRRVK